MKLITGEGNVVPVIKHPRVFLVLYCTGLFSSVSIIQEQSACYESSISCINRYVTCKRMCQLPVGLDGLNYSWCDRIQLA